MRPLSLAVAAFSALAFAVWFSTGHSAALLLAVFAAVCAVTTFLSQPISTFLRILVGIFATEVIVFGGGALLGASPWWPEALAAYTVPETLGMTVAFFAILVFAISHIPVVRTVARIADRYFEAEGDTTARIWPFPAFRAPERKLALWMIVFLIVLNQAQVGINVRLSFFGRDWFNAIQTKDEAAFWSLLYTVFLFWVTIYIASAIVEIVVQAMLTIRWRRYLTNHYVSNWLDGAAHYRISLKGGAADNPDQRIAEDVNRFIDGGQVGSGVYSYSIILISTLSNLVSFSIILWGLSSDFKIPGTEIAVPGILFWVALIYSLIGTFITHLIGRALTRLSFLRQRYEADFRFSLARLREYSEQVALLKGETIERLGAMARFAKIYDNFVDLMRVRKKLTAFTAFYGQISPFIPYIVAAPFYFSGKIALGVLTQTAGAFGRVEAALNFFVTYYSSLAEFRAVLDRLSGFDQSIARAQALQKEKPLVFSGPPQGALGISGLSLSLPDGRALLAPSSITLAPREAVLLNGPSGSGKSTLFRAISGIWPLGDGRVEIPAGAKIMLLPQKPYIPIGSLRDAVTYPSAAADYSDESIRAALQNALLGGLAARLDEEDNWQQRLSGGEQQRLAVARAFLAKPDWLFLDEATASLDEASEAAIYKSLAGHLPEATIVSIGHRSTLAAFHKRRLEMTASADGAFTLAENKTAAAAAP